MRLASFLSLILATVVACSIQTASAQDSDARLRAHLAAGEFGPAREIAEAAGDVAGRDRQLGLIATAQAASGVRCDSIETASYIQDDRTRSGVLQQISAQGPPRAVGRGGAAMADFDSLIDLITTTISPDSWDEVGGPGSIDKFAGGVYVDAGSVMRRMLLEGDRRGLTRVRREALAGSGNRNVRKASPLRKISINRLEKQVQLLAAAGHGPDDAMRNLAGLTKIEYVFVYPETGDIVIAGPAEPWSDDVEGRAIGSESRRPVVRLDDLVVLLRNAYTEHGRFSCSITPRKENLAVTKAYLAETSKRPLRPGGRAKWLKGLRDALGKQDIEVHGIDPATNVGRVLVEADYRMKLVGMGLEDGVLGVTSYLDMVKPDKNGALPPMDVLRWWFTLNYHAVETNPSHNAFQLRGPGVQVKSENELLTDLGERVHTGGSDELNREFAHAFTSHIKELSAKYPIYADLHNVFDLALVSAIIRAEDLPGQVGWHMTYFGSGEGDSGDSLVYEVERGPVPREVETIVNHRVINGTQIIAGVSGGVRVDTQPLVQRDAIQTTDNTRRTAEYTQSKPQHLPHHAWWWD
jgi:hypothetical protein